MIDVRKLYNTMDGENDDAMIRGVRKGKEKALLRDAGVSDRPAPQQQPAEPGQQNAGSASGAD